MKRKYLVALLILISTCFTQINAMSSKGISWYLVPRTDGKQPGFVENADFINDYDTIYVGNSKEKKVYFTFDAGYSNDNVEKIIDVLDRHDIKSIFFILPNFVKRNTELVKRMIENGHIFGNHSTTHSDLSKIVDIEDFSAEMTGLEDVFREKTDGCEIAPYYRPPEGTFSEMNLYHAQKLGYKTVFWSLAYADWDDNKQLNPEKALALIMSRMHNGCVLLLHPTSSTNATIIEELILRLKQEGYEFGTMQDFEKDSHGSPSPAEQSFTAGENSVISLNI